MKKLSFFIIALCFGQSVFAQNPVDSKGRPVKAPTNVTQLNTVKRVMPQTTDKNAVFLESGGVLVNANGQTVGRMSKNKNTYTSAYGHSILPEDERCYTIDSKGRSVAHTECKAKMAVCNIHDSKPKKGVTKQVERDIK